MNRRVLFGAAIAVGIGCLLGAALDKAKAGLVMAPTSSCGADPSPAQAAAVGYNCETFSDGNPWSLSTIDINNTQLPGFKWYTNWQFPHSASSDFQTNGFTSPGDLSIVGGDLLFAPQGPTTYPGSHTGEIITCYPTGSTVSGRTFTGGMYLEVQATWPNGAIAGEASSPINWALPTTFLTNGTGSPTTWFEIDNFDSIHGRSFKAWVTQGGTISNSVAQCPSSACTAPSPSGQKYGYLLVPAALNGGTAKVDMYANDVFVGAMPPPSGYTSSAFQTATTDTYCLVLGAAQNNPATYHTIRVWQQR